jgi:hypothetical protein
MTIRVVYKGNLPVLWMSRTSQHRVFPSKGNLIELHAIVEVYRSLSLHRNTIHLHFMCLFIEFKAHVILVGDEMVLEQIFRRMSTGFSF